MEFLSVNRWRNIVAVLVLLSSIGIIPGISLAERERPFRIGALNNSWGPTPMTLGLSDGLVELDYLKDKDFVLGVRFTQGDLAALPGAARQLVKYEVDLIFTSDAGPAKAAQQATTEIPIVFSTVSDPVGRGLVQSFARPGGNITGVSSLNLELAPKVLEVFHQTVPSLKRILFVYGVNDATSVAHARAYRKAARHLGLILVERAVHTEDEARAVLTQLRQSEVDGLLIPFSIILNIPGLALEAAGQRGIPSMATGAFWTEHGALASYGPNYYATGKQAARLVDKIMKGATPAEIPVETNSDIEFVINLKTVEALGLKIAPEVLFQATQIIK